MDIEGMQTALTDEGELRVVYNHWATEPDGSTWCTRCVVWLALNSEGDMFHMRRQPARLPTDLHTLIAKHKDKLKTILLLSRK